MKRIILSVEGMHCGMCEAHVNDAVRRAVNVKSVRSSHAKNRVEVVCDDGVDEAAIRSAIEERGYTVSSTESSPYKKKGLFARFKKG